MPQGNKYKDLALDGNLKISRNRNHKKIIVATKLNLDELPFWALKIAISAK